MGRLKASDFDFELPKEFIANEPVDVRDMSKLLVLDSRSGEVYHRNFKNIVDFLNPGDALVVNRSRVIPARILFEGKEIFLLKELGKNSWSCLVRPGKFFPAGKNFPVNATLSAEVIEILPDFTRKILFSDSPEKFGQVPLPPYIKSSRADFDSYQTIYADENGSVAAPTAGLHFTSELISKVKSNGVIFEKILLNVGLGTFMPVKSNFVDEHKMHCEFFDFSKNCAAKLNNVKAKSGRIFAVGTTTARVLESCFCDDRFMARTGETDIFFYPGGKDQFRSVDCLVTNFHLPKSTLIMLAAAFLEHKGIFDGRKRILELYEIAKAENYRFYSFGDAMLII